MDNDYEQLWRNKMTKPKSGKKSKNEENKNQFKAVLRNGTEIKGTREQVLLHARAAGQELSLTGGYYQSSSKGWLPIEQMHLAHTKNAIITHYENWLETTRKLSDRDFITALATGPAEDPFVRSLIEAFIKRVNKGESSTDKKVK